MNTRKTINWIAAITGILALVLIFLFIIFRVPDKPLSELKEKYGSKSSRYFPVQGMSLHFRDEGPATDSLPLVLLHGNGSSLHTWDSLVSSMAGKRCIRLDLPGFGLTGPHPFADYSVENQCRVIDSLLDFLQVDSCIVVGNSMGGTIAWNYALHRNTAKGLVLVDAGGFPMTAKGGNIGFTLARTPVVNQLVKYVTPRSIVEKSLRQSYGNPQQVPDAVIQRYYDLNLREGNRQAMIDRFQSVQPLDTSLIAKISVPVLILWGEKDQVIPVGNAYRFKKALPDAILEIYPELGHVPMEENPGRVAESVRHWLTLVRPASVE
jgi:pimeloyl-ACP methyl ester carboxylesterase